jgi:hypothetical protein
VVVNATGNGFRRASRQASGVVDAVVEAASDAAAATRSFLASEQGRRLRRNLATAVILAAPVISEFPVIRRTPMARILRTAAVGTLIVKGAEWLRDWEPSGPQSQVFVR